MVNILMWLVVVMFIISAEYVGYHGSQDIPESMKITISILN
jgi:hypothetical protein